MDDMERATSDLDMTPLDDDADQHQRPSLVHSTSMMDAIAESPKLSASVIDSKTPRFFQSKTSPMPEVESTDRVDPDELSLIPTDSQLDDISSIFSIQKTLGTGASAVVLKGKHRKTKECYALKRMKRSHPGTAESFKKERQILRKALHSNIVRYDSCYSDRESVFIATEYCSGGTMLSKILKMKRFSEQKAAGYIHSILSAIRYLHKINVVHRDLKCNNIVFDKPGIEGTLKLIDFGESKIVDPEEMYNECIGTIHFVPPEVCSLRSGNDLKAGDMWSIGVIVYILCCGEPPFGGDNELEIWERIQAEHQPLAFPARLSASCKEFMSGLLCHDICKRFTAEQALRHDWISGDAASTTTFSSSSYLQMLRQHQKEGNRLHQRMVKGLLAGMQPEEEQKMHRDLIKLNRKKSNMDAKAVTEHLFLYSNISNRSMAIGPEDVAEEALDAGLLGIASPEEIASRRITEMRFRAILSHSSDHYDPEEAITALRDKDGMIPIEAIVMYSSLDDEDRRDIMQQTEYKTDLGSLDEDRSL